MRLTFAVNAFDTRNVLFLVSDGYCRPQQLLWLGWSEGAGLLYQLCVHLSFHTILSSQVFNEWPKRLRALSHSQAWPVVLGRRSAILWVATFPPVNVVITFKSATLPGIYTIKWEMASTYLMWRLPGPPIPNVSLPHIINGEGGYMGSLSS